MNLNCWYNDTARLTLKILNCSSPIKFTDRSRQSWKYWKENSCVKSLKNLNQFQGEWVWINSLSKDEFAIPIGGRSVRTEKNKILVRDDEGKEYWIQSDQVIKMLFFIKERIDSKNLPNFRSLKICTSLHKAVLMIWLHWATFKSMQFWGIYIWDTWKSRFM